MGKAAFWMAVSVGLLAVFTAQVCAQHAQMKCGPLGCELIEVEEKVLLDIDGPIYGRRQIEETITKQYERARPLPVVQPTIIHPYQYRPPMYYGPQMMQLQMMPSYQMAPSQSFMQQSFPSGGAGGYSNCGPTG